MSSIPPTTRRLLVHLREKQPEKYSEVVTHLYCIREVLVHGAMGSQVHTHVHTDWWRLRESAEVLKAEAARLGVREAVALFERLSAMADQALLSLVQVSPVEQDVAVS